MQLVLHTGAHYTEEDRLLKCLLHNKEIFAKRGIVVPGPSNFRGLFRDTLNAMHKAPPGADARDILLEAALDDATADRLILSDPNFFRTPATAVMEGELYRDAPKRMMHMAQLFPDDDIEIYLAIRNPASLVPILFDKAMDQKHAAFWGKRGPLDLRWSETLTNIRAAAPEIPITVWCNEDLPLIWSQVIREIAGLDVQDKITGGFDLLATIMSKEGMQRFRTYMDNHPEMSEIQKRRVIAAFLDKFAIDDEIEEELDMPGWTEALVDEMSDIYDDDMETIQRIPGVTMITP
ncbi:MAG: hypothetical protein WA790_14675 [Sulfitobacter sp.]